MERINYHHTAMLVIDMQRAFVESGQPLCVHGAASTVPVIIHAVDDARARGTEIIWVRREYASDGSDMETFRRKQMQEKGMLDIMAHGSYGVQPVTGLEGEPGDPVIIKKRFSTFFHTSLNDCLRQKGIDTLLLAGTQTPNCVRATAFDAVSLDYRTIVLSDCTSSMNDDVQQHNLEDMRQAGTEIISSENLFRNPAETAQI